MRSIALAIAVTVLALTASQSKARTLGDAERSAQGYSIGGATFGMRLSDFEQKFPSARQVASGGSERSVSYEKNLSAESVAQFEFRGNRLVKMSVIYTFEGNDRVDNEDRVAAEMTTVFGRPQYNEDAVFRWFFPGVNRAVSCGPSRG